MKHYFYMELLLTQFLLCTNQNIPPQYLYKICISRFIGKIYLHPRSPDLNLFEVTWARYSLSLVLYMFYNFCYWNKSRSNFTGLHKSICCVIVPLFLYWNIYTKTTHLFWFLSMISKFKVTHQIWSKFISKESSEGISGWWCGLAIARCNPPKQNFNFFNFFYYPIAYIKR